MSAFNSFLDFATERADTMQNFAERFLKVHAMCISPLSRLTAISCENSNELVSLYLPCLSLGHFKIMALCWLLSSPLRFHLIYFEEQKYIKNVCQSFFNFSPYFLNPFGHTMFGHGPINFKSHFTLS